MKIPVLLLVCHAVAIPMLARGATADAGAPGALDALNVAWNTPSDNAAGSMPLGNGEVVVNVWVEKTTGDVLLLLARTDALSETCRFLKLGRLRLHFEGNPLAQAKDFRQEARLRDGIVEIAGAGLTLQVWVDAAAQVLHVTGASGVALAATATVECWRTAEKSINDDSSWTTRGAPFARSESADVFLPPADQAVRWYHRNEQSVVPKLLETQSLTGAAGAFDPLLHRTFGGQLTGSGWVAAGDHVLKTAAAQTRLDLSLTTYTAQTATVDEWLGGLAREAAKSTDAAQALVRTRAWWAGFWGRSWVLVKAPDGIARGYALQRYAQGFQGRGAYPIKFNGGFFYAEDANPDWRGWGDCYWFQNTRHMYHPMLACGDFDLMEPFFRMYARAVPLAESRTAKYHGAKGSYFPETMTLFGTYGSDYVWDRTGKEPKDVGCPWWDKAWNQGPEIVALMLDRWDFTHDPAFLKEQILPMAATVLRYFDTRFQRDARGKLLIDPTQAVETYWTGVVNDAPTVAGLLDITRRLGALPPEQVTAEQRALFARMQAACPALPTETRDGVRQLSPAEKYDPKRSNCENPELYPIWPYREVSLSRPELMAEGKAAYQKRGSQLPVGWGYDGNAAALLGLTDEAARILQLKCANSNAAYRWPATWGPNFDFQPDQNHGGNLLETANLMLLQGESGGKILLFPAWPQKWDVDFKLHAPDQTTVACQLKDGQISGLLVTPATRAKDVVLPAWAQPAPSGK